MTANATGEDQHRTVLLLLPSTRQMFPLSTAALSQAQASRKKLETDYQDAYLLDADGSVCRIEGITVLGPWGQGWARQILSRLTQGWRISVALSAPQTWELERLRTLVLDCLSKPRDDDEAPVAEAAQRVRQAATARDVFQALRLPPPQEALDVL